MKLGIFSDSHYSSAELTCNKRYNNKSLVKIKKAMEYFKENECDLVICLGDLIDCEKEHSKEVENLKAVSSVMGEFDMKTVVVMGNHDAFAFEIKEFYEILGNEYYPDDIHKDGKSLLFIDACYFRNGVHYMPGDSGWDNTFYPHTEEFKNRISNATGDIYVFSHQNIDASVREDHRVFNASQIRDILEESGRVKAVFQGHYHPGHESESKGISYRTFPAMCEMEDAYYIIEI